MVFEKPGYTKQKITPYIEGQRQARKGNDHNPYSVVSQRQQFHDWNGGWTSEMEKLNPTEVPVKNKWPHIMVLALGIMLAALIWYVNR